MISYSNKEYFFFIFYFGSQKRMWRIEVRNTMKLYGGNGNR